VTDIDEVNLIAAAIAKEAVDIKKSIVRIQNNFFRHTHIAEELGIDELVYPYSVTAKSISNILSYSKANNVKEFYNNNFKLISTKVSFDKSDKQMSIQDINSRKIKVVGIERAKRLFIPNLDDCIKDGDLIYLFGQSDSIKELCGRVNNSMPMKLKNIVIFGADRLGIEIAKELQEKNILIKIVEKDVKKCELASELLSENVTIINSKYGVARLYEDEGLKNADMVIATSNSDEENIITSIEAKEYGITKVVAINHNIEHYMLMHTLGIIAVRGPKTNAFYSIIELISSNSIISERIFCGGEGVSIARDIKEIGKTIKPPKKFHYLLFAVFQDKIIEISDRFEIIEETWLILFCYKDSEHRAKEWMLSL
jgi:trk system potassium uptake protein TrkA